MYMIAKHIHLTTVALSIVGFLLRVAWQLLRSDMAGKRWVKVIPHVNDSILFFSGVFLAWYTGQYPWEQGWLAAKVAALLVYIYLGVKALRVSVPQSKLAFAAAGVLVYAYMILVALNKSPWPF